MALSACRNGYLKRQVEARDGTVVKRMKMEQQGQAGEQGRASCCAGVVAAFARDQGLAAAAQLRAVAILVLCVHVCSQLLNCNCSS